MLKKFWFMHKFLQNILIILSLLVSSTGNAQVDQIIKPVEIHPPSPAMQQQQKKESDEQLAAQYFQNKDYENAVVLYEKLYKKNNNTVYYSYYMYCLVLLQEYKKAEKLVKEQMHNNPGNLKYPIDMGYVYSEEGDQTKAKRQFEDVIKDLPPDRMKIVDAANAFLSRGQTEYAVETYKRGNQIIGDYPFHRELGYLYAQTGNYSMMVEEFLDYLDFDNRNMPVVQANLQNVLSEDHDNVVSQLLRTSLLRRIQKNPDKVYYSEMLMWLSIQEKDFKMALLQAKAIDRRLGEDGERIYELAGLCIDNQEYDVAIEAYKYILKKGQDNLLYIDSKIGILNARYLKVTKSYSYTHDDLLALEKDYKSILQEYGKNASTITVMRYLGNLDAFYLDKTDEATGILYEAIAIPNAAPERVAECKIELADILLFTGDVWEAKLLYAQVEKAFKNDPIGYEAKFKNAKLSFYIGEFGWAKAQLDVLKAATSKLIANDALQFSLLINDNISYDSSTVELAMYARADLLLYRNKYDLALATLDSIFTLTTWHPIFDEALYKKAEIELKLRDFDKAAKFLSDIVEKYPQDITADDALFLLAELNEKQFNNKDKAMELYEKILKDYPGSLYTVDARKHYRYLRGDFSSENNNEMDYFNNVKPPN